jgi:hypothetical protein
VAACSIAGAGPLIARQFGATGIAALAAAVIAGQSLAQWVLARRLVGVWTHAMLCPWRSKSSH